MSRAKWKSPFLSLNSTEQLKKTNQNNRVGRNCKITLFYLGQEVKVHNGKNFVELQITESMVNHKFGEFAFTRAKYEYKRKKMRKKLKKKIKKKN